MSDFSKEAYGVLVKADMELIPYEEVVERLTALHQRHSGPDGHVAVPVELLTFLTGEGEYQGKSFGDEPEPIAGKWRQRYWWRKLLRPYIAAAKEDSDELGNN